MKYAEVLLSIVRPGEGYTEDRIRKMFGTGETDIQFPPHSRAPHLPDCVCRQNGKLQFRDDIYGRDRALIAILKGDDRKVADIPIERRENPIFAARCLHCPTSSHCGVIAGAIDPATDGAARDGTEAITTAVRASSRACSAARSPARRRRQSPATAPLHAGWRSASTGKQFRRSASGRGRFLRGFLSHRLFRLLRPDLRVAAAMRLRVEAVAGAAQ